MIVADFRIILNNVPLHDDIWLTDLRGLSTDKICRAIKTPHIFVIEILQMIPHINPQKYMRNTMLDKNS